MSTRCVATTNQGKHCTRNAVPGSLFCYQHQQKVMGNPKMNLEKKCLQHMKKWKNIDLADIPLKEFKTRTTKPSETRGRTLTRKSKSPKKKSRSRSPKECCVCLEKSEDTLKCKHTICVD